MENLDLSSLQDKTVLFVDDEEATRYAIERMLSKRFKKVWLAENGKEGLECYKQNHPDIVVTDIEMPQMNGLILLEEIKRIDDFEPVVIMTAFADEAHKATKADAILIKPVNRKALFDELLRLSKGNKDG